MSAARALLVFSFWAWPSLGATFGTIVQHAQPITDMVVDDARKRLYLVSTATNQIEVFSTTSSPPRVATTIPTDATPLSAAMSRSGKFLYVACYDGSSLVVIDLTSATFPTYSVSLAAKPEAVAVGVDEKVLISTASTSAGQSVLITYDPNAATRRGPTPLPRRPIRDRWTC
jgi:DNA-binding beta-propeller fold protein YncE